MLVPQMQYSPKGLLSFQVYENTTYSSLRLYEVAVEFK